MKKVLVLMVIAVFTFVATSVVCAQEEKVEVIEYRYEYIEPKEETTYDNSPINKLGRGVINAATCWAEIPAAVIEKSEKKDPFIGCTLGVVEGVFTGLVRGVVGIFDAVTFLVPPYNKPLMEPEYALHSADEKMREHLW